MKKYLVRTLGCKANIYDSQLIEAELSRRGWEAASGGAAPDLCIVNSCTVTDEADRQSRRLASRLFREHPNTAVVITGCAAEVDPERLRRSRGIHYVIGNRDKPKLVDLVLERLEAHPPAPEGKAEVLGVASGYEEILSRHPIDREWPLPEETFLKPPTRASGIIPASDGVPSALKTRAFLKIQEGCNAFCTYCIIPYGRGPSRSLRPREVLAQVRALVDEGIREVVITGTNIGDYGADWSAHEPGSPDDRSAELAALFRLILAESGLERLRVSSLDPTEISPAILALMREDGRFCPHFHVSLQAASDRVLRLMKRRYGTAEITRCLASIEALGAEIGRRPFVGMDVITGFPGESDEEFESGLALLAGLPWQRLHVFPYSEREGTPATRLPGSVPGSVRVARARRLGELSLSRMKAHYERAFAESRDKGSPIERVLFERAGKPPGDQGHADGARWYGGYTPEYLRVLVELGPEHAALGSLANRELAVRARALSVDQASGEVALVGELI